MLARALLTAVMSLAAATPALAKTYHASRFDVRIDVLRGGALQVTETIVFVFTDGTFKEVFRTIPTRRTDGVAFVSATMDGQLMPAGNDVGHVRVRRENGLRVEWRFPPVAGSSHTFELTYVVRGVVQQTPSADLLEWQALPREHDYRIESSSLEIVVPTAPAAVPRIEPRRVDGQADVAVHGTSVLAHATGIRRNGSFVVLVALPRHSVLDAAPAWQLRQLQQREAMPVWLTAAAFVMALGFVLLFGLRQNYDVPPSDLRMPWDSMIPPDAAAPAVAGALVANGQPHLEHAMAALFSLAERGVIAIREEPRRTFGSRHFTIERIRSAPALSPHEEAVLDVTFADASSMASSVTLSKARALFTRPRNWKRFKNALLEELARAEMLHPGRQASRRRYMKVGIGLSALAAVALIPCAVLADRYGGWPFLVPLAVFLISLASFIMVASQTPLSNEGLRRAERWRAFKKHIADPQRIEPRWGAAGTAEARTLPLAIALGLAGAWAKYLKKKGAQTPAWFHAASGLDSGHAFAAFVATGGAGAHGHSSATGGAAGGGASGAR